MLYKLKSKLTTTFHYGQGRATSTLQIMAQKIPFLKANRIARSGPRYPDTGGNIAAIDFGTTFCSLAYTTKGDDSITTFKFSETHQRTPNSILLHREESGDCETVEFGYRAVGEFLKVVKRRDSSEYIYFERIKMLLEKDEVSWTF